MYTNMRFFVEGILKANCFSNMVIMCLYYIASQLYFVLRSCKSNISQTSLAWDYKIGSQIAFNNLIRKLEFATSLTDTN